MAEVSKRQELDELRRLEELEQKAARIIDTSKLTDPHEIDFMTGRRGTLSEDEMQEAIRQYRSINKADQGIPNRGYTKIPLTKGLPQFQAEPVPPPSTIPPTEEPTSQAISVDSKSLFTPRIGMDDLMGPTGQAALTSGLAVGALTPTPFQPLGFIAGASGSLLAEEGTRRLQENFGETPGYLIGLALSVLTGGGVGKTGRTPSHPTQFKNVTIESPEVSPPIIPASKALHEVIPQGGAYSTGPEMLTPPSSRIDLRHQFSTGSGESLFGPLQRIDAPTPGPMGIAPIKQVPPQAWMEEGIPRGLQEKYPTLAEEPVSGVAPPKSPKPPGIDIGSTGLSGEYVPPKAYSEPPTPSKWRQAWNAEKQRWGQELPVLKTQPDSPVISAVESTHVFVEDHMESLTKQPWVKTLMKMGDNIKITPP